MNKEQYFDASIVYEKAISICAQNDCDEWIQKISENFASALMHLGRYEKALKYLLITYKTIDDNIDRKKLGIILNKFGNAYYYLQDYSSALKYYKDALKIFTKADELELIAQSHSNVAISLNLMHKHTKALSHFNKALELAKNKNNPQSISKILNNIGGTYVFWLKNPKKGITFLTKAVEIQKKHKYQTDLCQTKNNLGYAFSLLEDYDKGEKYIHQSIKLSKQLKLDESLKRSYSYLADLYERKLDFGKAVDFHKKYIDHNAKLINSLIVHNAEKHQEEIDKLSITLKAERKEREILDLNQKIELKNKELTSKAMIMAERQEALLKIFEEIDGIRKAHGGIMSPEFRKLYSDLQEQLSSDSQWDEFEKWFTEVQGDFFDHLRQKAPKLSSKELKISAFIKLRMSTKEIASLMRLTPKTIENHRWTIRKKIGLKKGDNLIQYLESI
ncbi:MAG: tetratricopeptide repeat protein [Candidatus Marinimicrobia bacterium]|jgi:tetratricopeptide (TPR) repeat protein|nr:tetratricopeptide repeat protein [Candidatus Neomarinimicrobiota bacterium]